MRWSSGSRSNSLKSFLASWSSTPSDFIRTVALHLASETSASSPKASPLFSSARNIDTPPIMRSTLHLPVSAAVGPYRRAAAALQAHRSQEGRCSHSRGRRGGDRLGKRDRQRKG